MERSNEMKEIYLCVVDLRWKYQRNDEHIFDTEQSLAEARVVTYSTQHLSGTRRASYIIGGLPCIYGEMQVRIVVFADFGEDFVSEGIFYIGTMECTKGCHRRIYPIYTASPITATITNAIITTIFATIISTIATVIAKF